ncbi:MAG: FHA domain-containing protein [Proteobacteria bacterium]|nr:MAG: FHA domain-containing protein [Pseudomonadota bacterium]
MSGAAVATPRTGFKFMISMTQGPDRGASYQLLPPKVTIGRGPDNNIVLKDPRVSRAAACIEFSPLAIMISDLSGRSTLFVNGEQVSSASIKDGDLIQVGETQFSFQVEAIALRPTGVGPVMSPGLPTVGSPPPHNQAFNPGFTQAQRPVSRSPQSGSRTPFVIICLVLAAAVYFLMTDKPVEKKEGLEGRRYRDKNMYTRCSAAFDKVMSSIPNKDDAKFKEAEQLKKECDFLENERYQ